MKKKKVKKLKKLFIEMNGRPPRKAIFDDKGKLIQEDEFRKFKKEYSTKV